MRRILLFTILTAIALQLHAVSHIYRGNSTYTSNIIATWDGRHLYRGNSTYTSDILLTWDGKYMYNGRSTYTSDIICSWDGRYLYSGRSSYSSDIMPHGTGNMCIKVTALIPATS